MAKAKTAYVCNECGAEFVRWQGQCGECKAWNTITEIRLAPTTTNTRTARTGYAGELTSRVQTMAEVSLAEIPRIHSGFKELDRVLGGGIVPGSAMLIGGHPGAGKSTLLLQTMCSLAERMPVLYITGEESLQQVAMRANRLGLPNDKLRLLAETGVEQICNLAMHRITSYNVCYTKLLRNTRELGLAVVALGGGRVRAADPIDYAVGLSEIISLGDYADDGT